MFDDTSPQRAPQQPMSGPTPPPPMPGMGVQTPPQGENVPVQSMDLPPLEPPMEPMGKKSGGKGKRVLLIVIIAVVLVGLGIAAAAYFFPAGSSITNNGNTNASLNNLNTGTVVNGTNTNKTNTNASATAINCGTANAFTSEGSSTVNNNTNTSIVAVPQLDTPSQQVWQCFTDNLESCTAATLTQKLSNGSSATYAVIGKSGDNCLISGPSLTNQPTQCTVPTKYITYSYQQSLLTYPGKNYLQGLTTVAVAGMGAGSQSLDGISGLSGSIVCTAIGTSTNTNVAASNTNSAPSTYSIDSDSDGLNNYLEGWLKTNATNPDSDGDSFQDGHEVVSSYSPLGTGTLASTQLEAFCATSELVSQLSLTSAQVTTFCGIPGDILVSIQVMASKAELYENLETKLTTACAGFTTVSSTVCETTVKDVMLAYEIAGSS